MASPLLQPPLFPLSPSPSFQEVVSPGPFLCPFSEGRERFAELCVLEEDHRGHQEPGNKILYLVKQKAL